MILYYFPPLGGVSSLRALSYVKHLPSLGWNPLVLTVQNGSKWEVRDETLIEEIPSSINISRTKFIDIRKPFELFSHLPSCKLTRFLSQGHRVIPTDRHIGWFTHAYTRARRLIKRYDIDIIYTLSSPITAHLIGLLLKEKTNKSWVAHFSDEWTTNPFYNQTCWLPREIDKFMEMKVLEKADHIATAWPGLINLLPIDISKKSTTITHSFNKGDLSIIGKINQSKKFRITYNGSFYATQQPVNFLSAIKTLLEEGKITAENLELVFVGQTRELGSVDIEGSILNKVVKCVGFVSHIESVRYLMETDVLLLIVSKERGVANIPGKTFEYIATGKPILALIPTDGATSKLLNKTKTGVIADPEDIESIKNRILELYDKWEKNKLNIEPNWYEINKYEDVVQSRKLAKVFEIVSKI